jgi:hypothetical protein
VLRAVATWAVVAAIGAVGIAAVVDALRPKHPERPTRPASSQTSAPSLGAQLRDAGVQGVLVSADDRCRLRAVRLPDLTPTRAPAAGCTIPAPMAVSHPPTWIEAGRVLQLVPCRRGTPCRRMLLSRTDLTRAAPYQLVPEETPFVARELAWISEDRLAVLVGGSYPDFVGVFRGRMFLYRMFTGFEPRSLRASPLGRYVVVEDDGPHVVRVGRAPRTVTFPEGLTTVRAVAWSPDERWLALATRASVWLMDLEDPGGPLLRLPIEAHEIGWSAG